MYHAGPMAAPIVKVREGFECPLCMAPLRPGTSHCKTCERDVPRPLPWQTLLIFLAMTGAVFFLTFLYFVAAPNVTANSAIALVRSQESAFVEQAMSTIRDKRYRFLGWDTELFGKRLVLVTFTYVDPTAGASGYMAVWWAVDLETGTATRVKSMQDFADNYLLKIDPGFPMS